MKKNLAFRRSTTPQKHPVRHLAALALLCPSLLAILPSSSHGAAATPDGATYTTATCTYVGGVKKWVYRVDPPEVQGFRLTVEFDPTRAEFNTTAGVLFKHPFNVGQTVDSTVAGRLVISASTTQTSPGDVDIFEIVFDDLNPLLPINNVTFTVGGGAGDFIQPFDPLVPVPALPPITGAGLGPLSRSVTPGILPMSFDPGGGYDNGTIGGPGVWDASTAVFDALPLPAVLNSGQTPGLVAWTNGTNLAVFGGNQGTGLVTVSNGISAGGLQFDSPGYHLSGGSLTLATPVGSVPTIEVRAGEVSVNTPVSGTAGFVKNGAGAVKLGGSNSFTGGVKINAGAVVVDHPGALNANAVSFGPSSTGKLSLKENSITISGLDTDPLPGTAVVENGGFLPATLTVNKAAGTSTFAGTLRDGIGSVLALSKTGTGTLVLSGANTYTGGTSVGGGVLVNLGSLAGGVVVQPGARLSGGGSIAGLLTVNPGGEFRPSVAGLPTTVNLGSVTLNAGGVFTLTLNSDSALADKLLVSTGADLGNGVAQLSVVDFGSTVLAPGTALTIIDNLSGGSGFFSGLPDGGTFVAGPNTFLIDYEAGAGLNDVQITTVPEPSSALLLTAALALGGTRRRRSRGE